MIGGRAMILAAGLGLRMRPLTLARPKPLVPVAGKALIDHGLDALTAAGVELAVVNKHYLPEQIEAWAASRPGPPRLVVQDESALLLDTGGGVARALPHLGPEPFLVLNSDSFWRDGPVPALERLRAAWDDRSMDCLLLLAPLAAAVGYGGRGDFLIAGDGRLARRPDGAAAPYVHAGLYLVHPRLFEGAPAGAFSMNLLWDRALARSRLHGLAHDGLWLHVGTPEAIGLAEAALARG